MKKVLLGSTAFLGAAVMLAAPAAAEMEVAVSGVLKAEFWGADQDISGDRPRGYNFGVDDSELHIKARNTADNGLTYGVTMELEVGDNVSADEAYLYFSGDNWGILQLGGNEGPVSGMPYSGDFSLSGTGGYDGGMSAVWNFQNKMMSPDISADPGDAAKINYYSPRFSGFQIGLSYTVDSGQAVANDDSEASDNGDMEDVLAIGLNYVDNINGVDVGIGGAYVTGNMEGDSGASTLIEDPSGYHIGFNVGFSGFSFGASYGDRGDTGCAKAASGCNGGEFFEIAGGYGTGPFSFGIGWFHGERDIGGGGGDEETDIFSVGGSYALAPGASIYTEINFVDEDNPAGDNEGTTYMIGTAISF